MPVDVVGSDTLNFDKLPISKTGDQEDKNWTGEQDFVF